MMGRVHKLTLLIMAGLFLAVGGWRAAGALNGGQGDAVTELDEEMRREIRFWDLYHEATRLRIDREYEQALDHYEEALAIRGIHQDALYYAGQVNLMLRSFEDAEYHWNRLVELNPGSPRSLLQLGTLYFCLEPGNALYDPSRAEVRYRQAWDLNREESGSPFELAKIAILNESYTRAADYLDIVTSANRMNARALFLSGFIKWSEGDHDVGEESLSDAQRLHRAMTRLAINGEGATERGAQAMIAEDLYCDFMGQKIDELLELADELSMDDLFGQFEKSLVRWRSAS